MHSELCTLKGFGWTSRDDVQSSSHKTNTWHEVFQHAHSFTQILVGHPLLLLARPVHNK